MFVVGTFLKHGVPQDRLVIDAAIILTLVQEMEIIDASVIHVFASDFFKSLQ